LRDPDGLYGIKETVSGTVVVAINAPTVHPSTGVYTYDISALDTALAYIGFFYIIRENGDEEYEQVDIPIVTADTGDAYCTIAEADAYFSGRLNTDAWDDATSGDQVKALVQATRMIDRLNFKGEMTDEDQQFQFPRDDDTLVPEDIKYACSEIALALLDGVDPELEFDNLRMVSQGYANVRSTYDKDSPPQHFVAGIPSVTAWRYLKPYLRDVNAVDLSRVS